ncbi:MAG: HD domain-containing protein, partial [Limisphaerales bacterium]
MRLLEDSASAEVYGRACIVGTEYFPPSGVVTVGGFRSSRLQEIAGVLRGEPQTAARDSAMPTVTTAALRAWASEQAELIAISSISRERKLHAASVVMLCGGNASALPVAIRDLEYLTASSLAEFLRDLDEVELYLGSEITYDEDDNVRPKDFKNDFVVSSKLFFVPRHVPSILKLGAEDWPACIPGLHPPGQARCCEDVFHATIKTAWEATPEYDEDSRVVGEVAGEEILRRVRIYTRPRDLSRYA